MGLLAQPPRGPVFPTRGWFFFFKKKAGGQETQANQASTASAQQTSDYTLVKGAEDRFGIYTDYTLTSDISHLTTNQKEMLGLLIEAAKIMDDLFWQQAFAHDKRTGRPADHREAGA